VTATLARVLPSVFVRTRNEMNHVLVAFAEVRSLSDVRAALDAAPPAVSEIAREVSREVRTPSYGPDTIVLTDDRAPVELLTGRMMQAARAAGIVPQR
jgi:hypothetical protein